MTSLHPTKTRLALLQAVAEGEVHCDLLSAERHIVHQRRLVSASVRLMQRAGWVEIGPRLPDERHGMVTLTPAGRAVLEAGRGGGG